MCADAIATINAELDAGRDVAIPGFAPGYGVLFAKSDRLRLAGDGRGARRVRYGKTPRDSYFFGAYVEAAAARIVAIAAAKGA